MLFRSISTTSSFAFRRSIRFDRRDTFDCSGAKCRNNENQSFQSEKWSQHIFTYIGAVFSSILMIQMRFRFFSENESKTIGTTRRATWCDVFNSRRSHHRPKSSIWSDWHWNFEFSPMSKFLRKISHKLEFTKKNVQNALKLRLNTQKSHHTVSVDWYQNEDSIRFIDFTWKRSESCHGTPSFSVFWDKGPFEFFFGRKPPLKNWVALSVRSCFGSQTNRDKNWGKYIMYWLDARWFDWFLSFLLVVVACVAVVKNRVANAFVRSFALFALIGGL